MTSKALEAAYSFDDVQNILRLMSQFPLSRAMKAAVVADLAHQGLLVLSDKAVLRSIDRVRDLIRAYAENVTDEMAEQCTGQIDLWHDDEPNGFTEWQACPEQIRAAILKGLE